MKKMVFPAIVAMMLAGCGPAGLSPDQLAALSSEKEVNNSLARDHKITYVEAATRNIAATNRLLGSRVNDDIRLLQAFRMAVAAEVDAGRMTPEMADYKVQEKTSEITGAEQQRKDVAIQNASNALIAFGQSQQATRQVSCMSTQVSGFVHTTCN